MAAATAARPPLIAAVRRARTLQLPSAAIAVTAAHGGAGRRRRKAARRLFLGLGATVIDQFALMSSGSGEGSGLGLGLRRFTASAWPLWQQGVSPVEKVLKDVEWPEEFPFKAEDFSRYDESPDTIFYSEPRFVTHIDDPAISALTKYYSKVFPPSSTPGVCLLDLCSSWVSHYPPGYRQDRIVGMGMNEEELKRNPVLTEYVVQDLNVNPKLPFDDNCFDVITNVVSVDYLTKPINVFKEINRVLKPGGLAIMSFSNRCFWTKAISIWTLTGDVDHAWIVGAYFHYSAGFEPPVEEKLILNTADALTKQGFSAFRFDFSGNGESEGEFKYGNNWKEANDLRAVVLYFSERKYEIRAIFGHSKGGDDVLLYASIYRDVMTVINSSGRFDLKVGIKDRLGEDFMGRIKRDGFIDVTDKTGNVLYRVTEESLMDRLNTDMRASCLSIDKNCRVLTIHGSADELVPVEDASEFAKVIPNHKLHIIRGADHRYTGHEEELASAVVDFLKSEQVESARAVGYISRL